MRHLHGGIAINAMPLFLWDLAIDKINILI